jgi:SAM-dependent methyltransferase
MTAPISTALTSAPQELGEAAGETSWPLPRTGTPEQMARLYALLRQTGFNFDALRQKEAREEADDNADPAADEPKSAFDVVSKLFTDCLPVSWELTRRFLPAELIELLDTLGLIEESGDTPDSASATIMLSPLQGLYLASDRPWYVPGTRPPNDLVFSPLTLHTQHATALMPHGRCEALLELCSGSGVGALDGARLATQAWAVDITERSTRFAQFNAALNGITNATALQGDLYEPVRGLTFDRILAHPPYMPAFQQEMIFRDGGADGEQITRRIIEGLPTALRPGGRLYCVCLATDRADAPLEMRVRKWLGDAEQEFDVLVVETQPPENPTSFYAMRAYLGSMKFQELESRDRFFKEAGVTGLVMSAIVIQRHLEDRPAFTERRSGSSATTNGALEWVMHWESTAADPATPARIADAAPEVSNNVAVRITHTRRNGDFVPASYQIVIDVPFRLERSVKQWLTTFIARCDGRTTVREHLVELQSKHIVPPHVTAGEFARLVMDLVGDGILQLPGHEIPARITPIEFLAAADSCPSVA